MAEKKRESIMVGFNATKSQLSGLEHALKCAQVDLEKTQFALEVKKGARAPAPCTAAPWLDNLPGRSPSQALLCVGSAPWLIMLRCSSPVWRFLMWQPRHRSKK